MRSRPFYRWKSFWLGITTLAFLIWLSIATSRKGSGIQIGDWFNYHAIASGQGAIQITKNDQPSRKGTHRLDIKKTTIPFREIQDDRLFWRPAFQTYPGAPSLIGPTYQLHIAWWFVFLLYLILWIGAITLIHPRARRSDLLENPTAA